MRSSLSEKAVELGFTTVGVASADSKLHTDFLVDWLDREFGAEMHYLRANLALRESVEGLLPGCRSVIAVTLNYHRPNPTGGDRVKVAQYALGRDYHKVLRSKLHLLGRWLEERHPGSQSRACVDSAPVLEREWAQLAGLGWFGKNTMLIDSRRGSWFFIGILLTTAVIEPDSPAEGGCGTCRACVEACPTGAIVQHDGIWQVDSRRCVSYLTIEHKGEIDPSISLEGWTYGCDICQEVCPFNQPRPSQPLRAQFTTEPDFRQEREWPQLDAAANLTEESWHSMTLGSAARRAKVEAWRRNASINLAQGATGVFDSSS
jgi:epoxyqueuosine reductase